MKSITFTNNMSSDLMQWMEKYSAKEKLTRRAVLEKALSEFRKSVRRKEYADSFKKALILNLGTDSANVIAQVAVVTISFGVSQLGKAGEVVGSVVNVVGKEAVNQATSFANIAAMYILYRFARKEMHGQEQSINENIYKIVQ